MKSCKLSIILPVYNVENYIEECISSILKISSINYELIIVNDGSTDQSINRIESLISSFPNVRVINQINKGLSAARNTGMASAKGEYIWFIDSDDVIDSLKIEELFEYELSEDIVVFDFIKFNKTDISEYSSNIPHHKIISGKYCLQHYYLKELYTVVWRNLYKRDFLKREALKFLEGILYEDVEWMPRVLYKAKTVSYYPITIYKYRVRSESIVNNTFKRRNYDDIITVCNSLNSFLKKEKVETNIKNIVQDSMNYFLLLAICKYSYNNKVNNCQLASEIMYNLKHVSWKFRLINSIYRFTPALTVRLIKNKFKGL